MDKTQIFYTFVWGDEAGYAYGHAFIKSPFFIHFDDTIEACRVQTKNLISEAWVFKITSKHQNSIQRMQDHLENKFGMHHYSNFPLETENDELPTWLPLEDLMKTYQILND